MFTIFAVSGGDLSRGQFKYPVLPAAQPRWNQAHLSYNNGPPADDKPRSKRSWQLVDLISTWLRKTFVQKLLRFSPARKKSEKKQGKTRLSSILHERQWQACYQLASEAFWNQIDDMLTEVKKMCSWATSQQKLHSAWLVTCVFPRYIGQEKCFTQVNCLAIRVATSNNPCRSFHVLDLDPLWYTYCRL